MASVLLAEDSPTHTALMKRILESGGHQVTCVTDGQQALDQLALGLPELIVTDLRMPNINGMELVSKVASDFPQLPSIVVTARGSESLAVDALAQGACNFVPKNSLGKLLLRVTHQTIRMAKVDQAVAADAPSNQRYEWTINAASNVDAIEPIAWLVIQSLSSAGHLDATQRMRIGTSVSSAIFNAVCYGNLQIRDDELIVGRLLAGDPAGIEDLAKRAKADEYRGTAVTIKVSIGQNDTRISVCHSGKGRATRMSPAPGTPESFELEQCRGLMLISSFMDEVILRGDSTEVIMVKQH